MRLAMIGLGKMGGNMVRRLTSHGHELVVWDRSRDAIDALSDTGATAADGLADVCARLEGPRVIWMMVPAGEPVDETIAELRDHLAGGDILIDGGNSNFHDTLRRAERLRDGGIRLIDAGTSGGVWGLEVGYCLMVGGVASAVEHCRPIFDALAPEDGFAHVGPSGAGHYVKMGRFFYDTTF